MFELLSALFLIAESNEFRLARFYHVCEEVCLVLLGSPLIVCGFVGHIRGLFKRGKDTESDVPTGREEILSFQTIEDLMNIQGIGEKTYLRLREYLCL